LGGVRRGGRNRARGVVGEEGLAPFSVARGEERREGETGADGWLWLLGWEAEGGGEDLVYPAQRRPRTTAQLSALHMHGGAVKK
jgi:hypothetical protein